MNLSMCFGWTFEHIDEFVTLPQLKEMSAYWAKNPPLHWRGLKKTALASDAAVGDTSDLLREFGLVGGHVPDLEKL